MRRLTVVLLGLVAGCHKNTDLAVRLDGPTGEFLVVVVHSDGSIEKAFCPTTPSQALTCDGAGVVAGSGESIVEVTVKASGFAHLTVPVAWDDLPREGGVCTLTVSLDKLAAFETNEDYATGFGADDVDLFQSMAWTADTELGPTHIVKFYIPGIQGEPRVYFQNTLAHPIHYDFAREVLGEAVSTAEFWDDTYTGEDRTAMAGSLVLYDTVEAPSQSMGDEVVSPVAVTFFPADDLSPAQALLAHDLLEERILFAPLDTGGPYRAIYLPAGTDQEADLSAQAGLFESHGSAWMLLRELWGGVTLQILNEGEAYGTLSRLSPEELSKTVVSYTDVLLLTNLPNELPIVGGTITEAFQTPLAHVNLAAMARGTPNIAWLDAWDDPTVQSLIGGIVHFKVDNDDFILESATLEEAQAFWDSRVPKPVELSADLGTWDLADFDTIGFDDAIRYGVKAANLAELHQLLPEVAPFGFAVPFTWYDDFMETSLLTDELCESARDDCIDEGRSKGTCEEARGICLDHPEKETMRACSQRLQSLDAFRSDTILREALLDGLRHHIRNVDLDPALAQTLNGRILETLGKEEVKLRSSTNSEDLDDFSGAGLYDSYDAVGFGDDDLASEEVRKVWASTWNWAAYEERSYWGIVHDTVYMGVAVNPAFNDEAANGVLITQNLADTSIAGMYVNVQLGDAPVTNPEDGTIPEIFSIIPGSTPGQVQVARLCWSSLSPGVPIMEDYEVQALYEASATIQEHFSALYGESPEAFALDLEFKLVEPDRALVIKQVRPFVGG